MGLTDVLFGRKKLKEPAQERLFALSTAQVTLDTECGLKPAGVGAICFKPLAAGEFVRAENEVHSLLEAVAESSKGKVERREDTYGFQWIVVHDPDLEDLVNDVHLVADELQARGFGAQLLAAVFKFGGGRNPVYWVYGYKRGKFWPFVPTGQGQERDNATEMQLKAKLDPELPIEPDVSVWFGFYDAPL